MGGIYETNKTQVCLLIALKKPIFVTKYGSLEFFHGEAVNIYAFVFLKYAFC
jgi:hypothetical protein